MLSLGADKRHDRTDWEAAAAGVLRKLGRLGPAAPDSDAYDLLTRSTLDGIPIAPLGTAETVAGLSASARPGRAPYTRGSAPSRPEQGWDIRSRVATPDPAQAQAIALEELERGATSLWLGLGHSGFGLTALERVLADVFLDLAPVVLDSPEDPVAAAEVFVALVTQRQITPAPGTSLAGDPIGTTLRGNAPQQQPAPEVIARLADLAQAHGTRALTVDATAAHDRGATDAQELGYSLAVGASYLRELEATGIDVAIAAELIDFRYTVTVEQTPSIAKLRAARRLWSRVLQLCGLPAAAGQLQHAVTSRAMMTRYDPWVNILRGTLAAFAAGVGGANSVTVLPFDNALGSPDALARRIARNISVVLVHESHLAKVSDPAGGAFALERFTHDLGERAWAQFQQIELEGGAAALAETGFLGRVQDSERMVRRAVATRERPLTGVSEFPNDAEHLLVRTPHPNGAVERTVHHYADSFEELRDAPTSTAVFVATLGPVAAHTARATFVHNLLTAGGVETVSAGATTGVADVLRVYGAEPVVCLAGSDAAYAEWGSTLVDALRSAGAMYVILAGHPGAATVAEDQLEDSCSTGIDAISFLHRVRIELNR